MINSNNNSNTRSEISLNDNTYYEDINFQNIPSELLSLGNKSINKILAESGNENLLIFPDKDKLKNGDQNIFTYSIESKTICTGNIVGFIKKDNYTLNIKSRFNKKSNWFLFYMLSKVFDFNLVESEFDFSLDSSLDLLPLLFMYQLKKALKQGVYKEYVVFKKNDYKPKGSIDFSRHIKQNYPFINGKIAYSYRSRSTENNVNYLIRYIYELLSKGKFGNILKNSEGEKTYKEFCLNTEKYYDTNIQQIIKSLLNFVPNPLYNEYQKLIKICLLIINSEKISIDEGDGNTSGILFDVSYIWENYLDKVFNENSLSLLHPDNTKFIGGTNLFTNRTKKKQYTRFPDFTSSREPDKYTKLVCDAKYKRLKVDYLERNDINQMVTYMYMFQALNGIFINPKEKTNDDLTIELDSVGTLIGYGNNISVISVPIPSNELNFKDFCCSMKKIEKELTEILELKN
jgi:5-methylcytosine-specific restriction endonuclease McrBC regulatory subunit McrC